MRKRTISGASYFPLGLRFLAFLARDSPFPFGIAFKGVGGPVNAPLRIALSLSVSVALEGVAMSDAQNDPAEQYPYGAAESNGFKVALLPPENPLARDVGMGQFMDAWSVLERQAQDVFWALLGTPHVVAQTIMGGMFEASRFKEVMFALGKLKLGPKRLLTLERLCSRMDGQTKWRNRIVHGKWSWVQNVKSVENAAPIVTGKWVRVYSPIDPDIRQKIGALGQDKITASHHFDVERIATITKVVCNVSKDFRAFSNDILWKLCLSDGKLPQLSDPLPDE